VNEFELIQSYFSRLGNVNRLPGEEGGVVLGIGDDCAILQPPPHSQLVVSTDTFISGVHFPDQTSPFDIGYKALAVNLSDLAAMGAMPLWFTLCVTLPSADEQWVSSFCDGMESLIIASGIHLVGGDTTKGPLSISIHVTGAVTQGLALRRDGAKVGDDIYVSGEIGHGVAGLDIVLAALGDEAASVGSVELLRSLERFNRPKPRNDVGGKLSGLATSAIDISDGLLVDLRHILQASQVVAELDMGAVPVAPSVSDERLFVGKPSSERRRIACSGGDDYELCFTAPGGRRDSVEAVGSLLAVPLTRVGRIIAKTGTFRVGDVIDKVSQKSLPLAGYNHFS